MLVSLFAITIAEECKTWKSRKDSLTEYGKIYQLLFIDLKAFLTQNMLINYIKSFANISCIKNNCYHKSQCYIIIRKLDDTAFLRGIVKKQINSKICCFEKCLLLLGSKLSNGIVTIDNQMIWDIQNCMLYPRHHFFEYYCITIEYTYVFYTSK